MGSVLVNMTLKAQNKSLNKPFTKDFHLQFCSQFLTVIKTPGTWQGGRPGVNVIKLFFFVTEEGAK
jgi:hypothetical protein